MRNEDQLFPPSLTLSWGVGASGGDRDPAGGSCGQLTDVGDGGDAAPLQGRVECGGAVRGDGDEQTAGGLGVGQEEAGLLLDAPVVGELVLQETKNAGRTPPARPAPRGGGGGCCDAPPRAARPPRGRGRGPPLFFSSLWSPPGPPEAWS